MTTHRIATKTTYLEMLAPVACLAIAPPTDLEIVRLDSPSPAAYRELYTSVGRNWNWVDRVRMPDDELRRIVADPQVEIYMLRVAGRPAGYAELDRRAPNEIEIAYFGLFPKFIGQGLGKYLLRWALDRAWSYQPRRVWVHTCDLDHPAALPNYLNAGFQKYDERIVQQIVGDG